MNIKTLLALCATTVLSIHFAQAQAPAPAAGAPAKEEDTPLAKEMQAMNKSYKQLKKQIADPAKKDENVGLIESIKKNVDNSVKLDPAKATEVPAADKAAFLEKYKKATEALKASYDELEAAVKSDNAEGVKAALAKIDKEKKDGHHEFQTEK